MKYIGQSQIYYIISNKLVLKSIIENITATQKGDIIICYVV